MESDFRGELERVFRESHGRVLASLIRSTGDFDLAEEALQDALAAAVANWPQHGVPENPVAWLLTAARNKAIDRVRRRATRLEGEAVLQFLAEESAEARAAGDERLSLFFTCCHPALALDAQVALTLRTLGGLTTPEIARAFLVPEETLAQRIVRAKRKIRKARIPYRVPPDELLHERRDAVLTVLYLVFNEGYSATTGSSLLRLALCREAIRLARVLTALMPEEPEVLGVLALMLLHDSRRGARLDAAGDIVLLQDQDRSLWDRAQIAEGAALTQQALSLRRPGPFQIQAAIAALHAESTSGDDTDWMQIAELYGELERHTPTPVVALNRAVAVAMARGPEAGLARLDAPELRQALAQYCLYHSARANLLRRAGRIGEAAESYAKALSLAGNDPERRFLSRRLDALTADASIIEPRSAIAPASAPHGAEATTRNAER